MYNLRILQFVIFFKKEIGNPASKERVITLLCHEVYLKGKEIGMNMILE
jgi:hypothetical protein